MMVEAIETRLKALTEERKSKDRKSFRIHLRGGKFIDVRRSGVGWMMETVLDHGDYPVAGITCAFGHFVRTWRIEEDRNRITIILADRVGSEYRHRAWFVVRPEDVLAIDHDFGADRLTAAAEAFT